MLDDNTSLAVQLRTMLAKGLDVKVEAVDGAIEITRSRSHAADWAWYCENFVPHAVILCERSRPSNIFSGGKSPIRMPEESSPVTFAQRALDALPNAVLGYGDTTGFIVNYTPDDAVEFDKEGSAVRVLARAYRPHHSKFSFGRITVLPPWP